MSAVNASEPAPFSAALVAARSNARLSQLTTVTSFATAVDVTIAELRLEAFLPADAQTATRLESLQVTRGSSPPVALPGLVP